MQNPAQSLMLEYLHPEPDAHILLLEGGDGCLAAQTAQMVPAGKVLLLSRDVRDIWAAQSQLDALPNAYTSMDVYPQTSPWDSVLITIPKGRRYSRTLLLAAWEALKPGGRLLLAGPTKAGAKAVIKDAQRLFGNATALGFRSHQRVATCIRENNLPHPLPMEFQQPGIAPGTQHFVEIKHPEGVLRLETHPGIFSWEALDEGTALLLEHLKIDPGTRVWDVGCGYGAIGLSAGLAGAAFVAMNDINILALRYAQLNALRNGLTDRVHTFLSDGLDTLSFSSSAEIYYDLIISNPAFHQGREIDKSMADSIISLAPKFLAPEGRLVIVANRFLNYDRSMQEHFTRVVKLAETKKFHVIQASL